MLCNKSPYPPSEGGPMAMNSIVNGLLEAGHKVKILAVNSEKYHIKDKDIPQDYKEKTGIAYGIPDLFKEDSDNDTFDNEDVTPIYKKTGRTKSILGYKCEEYAYSDESSKGTFWVPVVSFVP